MYDQNNNIINELNKLIEGYVDLHGNSALANRPLPSIKQCPCSVKTRNDLSNIKPNYDNNNNFSSSEYSDKSIPVVIKRYRDRYYVLENKDDSMENGDVYNDNWADLSSTPNISKDENNDQKMNLTTRFYYGSISIIALYILFRTIQKSR